MLLLKVTFVDILLDIDFAELEVGDADVAHSLAIENFLWLEEALRDLVTKEECPIGVQKQKVEIFEAQRLHFEHPLSHLLEQLSNFIWLE